MLTGVETQRLLSPLGNEASLQAERRKEGEGALLSLQRAACERSSGSDRPVCVLHCRQNYNLWILHGLTTLDRKRYTSITRQRCVAVHGFANA